MSHFSSIGFKVENQEDYVAMLRSTSKVAEQHEARDGFYLHYRDVSGAEVWLQSGDKGIHGINPHYHGESRWKLKLRHEIKRSASVLDGAFYTEAIDKDPPFPFIVDMPNLRMYNPATEDFVEDVQLCAFAESVALFDNEDEYNSTQTDGMNTAVKSFIPSSLWEAEKHKDDPDAPDTSATSVFSGNVLDSAEKTNHLTGEKFTWLLVDTLGGPIDVVGDSRVFPELPKKGCILQGSFWISGVFVE